MQVDILAIGAHPDDVELGAGGTLAKHVDLGYKVAILDLTQGEMGTRGTPEIRVQESQMAAEILKASARYNCYLSDGWITADEKSVIEVVKVIRHCRPRIVIANAPHDRHPDHGAAAQLVAKAVFSAGFSKLKTTWEGLPQAPWRPQLLMHYIQFINLQPDIIVDITGYFQQKIDSCLAHKSQLYNPESKEPETVISSKEFLDSIEYRARDMGRLIGTQHGEGFIFSRTPGIKSLSELL
ncbi:bacillithiol biosynthesis deacetylase BshB1 [Thermaurantimonas aggregans]|uniref:Bacillithiol biosynthesis deacetylase BshB1 n=1 Tax=Thermaurantimonas aggregans TaxID=2173829 RepID=A0A401XKD7_9FLAO|nr:bacillithiol biosynthesis deacetylase BshB1 [Thermaurantimonas aggregans]MCX8148379.1 bacillithiol biosynthesis deacetylase BshB1 [Thermaurantimonas aggregans]GCD77431.1 bacillithiol biosynthesis deacetylase BshB1 [Thermaurantimonas aggregans]